MSSEPPFDHPPDHTRYGDPPMSPPRSMPWLLTAGFKTGCGLVLGFLLTQCCLCGTMTLYQGKTEEHLKQVDHRLDGVNKKLDELSKKPAEPKKDEKEK